MATIERFEDITAWQKARALNVAIYACSREGTFARDFGLRDQLRGAAVSIMSNIAEGFERDGNREFVQFLATAKGSCGEVRSQLYTALDQGYVDRAQFDHLSALAQETSRLVAGLMRYLRQSTRKGRKYD